MQIVPSNSAIIGIQNERVEYVAADHKGICRFESRQSQKYKPVEAALSDLLAYGRCQLGLESSKPFIRPILIALRPSSHDLNGGLIVDSGTTPGSQSVSAIADANMQAYLQNATPTSGIAQNPRPSTQNVNKTVVLVGGLRRRISANLESRFLPVTAIEVPNVLPTSALPVFLSQTIPGMLPHLLQIF
jgi:hypothetical protein